jgi:cellulose synthase/poly-beta-1,6-N-acetylglucosamine synthase-like glycosyltransferase
MKVCAIVPIAPFEPLALIEKSIKSLSELDYSGFDFEAYYVIDGGGEDHNALFRLLPPHFHIMLRNDNRGRRAGAINDALNVIEEADYIAIFDVDSRPNLDFLKECLHELTETNNGVLASGCRFVTNKVNTLTKIVAIEYKFFCDIYRLGRWARGFIQFNGAIGVAKTTFLRSRGLNESSACEDLDFSAQIYLAGNSARLANTRVGEQAPICVHDLFHQRVRWFHGAVEGLRKYLASMLVANVPTLVKITWLGSLTVPFFSFLLAPFVPIYLRAIAAEGDTMSESVEILFGLIGYTCLMTLCGAVAVGQHLASRKSEWYKTARSEV